MNLDDMRTLYQTTMGLLPRSANELFTVRVWDGMDGCWCDVVAGVDLAFALQTWCDRTENGTQQTRYSDIDYYRIFPADTKMLYSDDFTMRGDDDR